MARLGTYKPSKGYSHATLADNVGVSPNCRHAAARLAPSPASVPSSLVVS